MMSTSLLGKMNAYEAKDHWLAISSSGMRSAVLVDEFFGEL